MQVLQNRSHLVLFEEFIGRDYLWAIKRNVFKKFHKLVKLYNFLKKIDTF